MGGTWAEKNVRKKIKIDLKLTEKWKGCHIAKTFK
jgi:hypothetical protein